MRPPRLRFTIRVLLIAVAIAALSAWSYAMWRRSVRFARMAQGHKFRVFTEAINLNSIYVDYPNLSLIPSHKKCLTDSEKASSAISEQILEYERIMYEKYRHAAQFSLGSESIRTHLRQQGDGETMAYRTTARG